MFAAASVAPGRSCDEKYPVDQDKKQHLTINMQTACQDLIGMDWARHCSNSNFEFYSMGGENLTLFQRFLITDARC